MTKLFSYIAASLLLLAATPLMAQVYPSADFSVDGAMSAEDPTSVESTMPAISVPSAAMTSPSQIMQQLDYPIDEAFSVTPELLKARNQLHAGKVILITAGALTVASAGMYACAWYAMGEGGVLPTTLSVAGITGISASLILYVTGSVMYVKGKKSALRASPGGIALNF